MPTPGADTSMPVPKLEKLARAPLRSVAATAITLLQLAGLAFDTLTLSLPAATTTTVPRPTAPLIAFCDALSQAPVPPRLMLITSAGLALVGTPLTAPPDAQVIASTISEVNPPPLPSTRAGTTLALNATPATPLALLVTAATVPDTWVPCQLEFCPPLASPGSWASLSRPPPSAAMVASLMKS